MILMAPHDNAAGLGDPTARVAFLTTHRAIGVLKREMTRLAKELVTGAKLVARERAIDAPEVRQTPDQCIVQLGPVALTISWLRNGSDAPHAGQLMAVVWRGIIAPRGDHSPERLGLRGKRVPPVTVWEETSVVSADSEASWHWHPAGLHGEGYPSPELAARLLAQLSAEYERAVSIAA